jgi:lambda family phage portal protein
MGSAIALRSAPVRVLPAPSALPTVKPSLLDRAIGAIAPMTALRRYEARVKMAAASYYFGTGGYEGARTDRPATKNWQPKLGSADSDSVPDLPMLRARAADLERNDPIAFGIGETKSTHIVGAGIIPRARIDREFLGLTDEQADAWERDCDRIVTNWMESGACDITRKNDFFSLEEMVLLGALSRGDILAVRRFKEQKGDLLGTRVQLVEADRIGNPSGRQNSDTLIDGVESDTDGRVLRYYVARRHPGEMAWGFGVGGYSDAEPDVIDAFGAAGDPRALLVFRQRRPGQTRGVPLLAPVIERLKQISRYGESELMAAVIQSFFTVFIKTNTGEDGLTDMGDPNTLAGATSTPATANDVRLGQGAVVGLAPGESIETANPTRPNSSFDPFMLSWFRQIGIAVNIPYEILIKHFASSFSASRGAMLEFYRGVTKDRIWLVRRFCQPAREWALEEAVARGLLSAPGFFDSPLVRAAYCRAEWTGPAMGQLDPKSEVDAAVARMAAKLTTLADETSQMTGGAWEHNLQQIARETRVKDVLGLLPPAPDPAAPTRPPTPSQADAQRDLERQADGQPGAPVPRQTTA